jgi:hypothetical protein
VPDGDNMHDYPEQLLAGSDRPRPIPPHLRARLEEALESAGAATDARPLSVEVRDKLEVSLRSGEPEQLEGAEQSAAPGQPDVPEKKWRSWAPRLSVAAAVIIALAIFVPTLAHGPSPSLPHGAASTEPSRSGLNAIRALPPSAVAVPANGKAAASTSSAPAVRAPAPTVSRLGPEKSELGAPTAAFAASAPSVDSLSPTTGAPTGGDWVTVRGTNLSRVSAVYFGRVPARRVSVESGTELKALTPAHPVGTVDVVVKGPAGQSKVSPADRYSFAP